MDRAYADVAQAIIHNPWIALKTEIYSEEVRSETLRHISDIEQHSIKANLFFS